jgi:hypothetical protein
MENNENIYNEINDLTNTIDEKIKLCVEKIE